MHISPRVYIKITLSLLSLLVLPLGVSVLFLYQSGELREPEWIGRWLQSTNGLYGTALNSNAREIALAIYLERRPQVAVLSSSRGTEFREEFFSQKFSCACMMMSNLEEGHQFFDAVRSVHLPRMIVIALDYWWFSKTDDHTTRPPPRVGKTSMSRESVLAPFRWFQEGKLSAVDVVSIGFGRTNGSALSIEPKLGFQAIKKSFGTRADGSWSVMSVAANVDLHPALVNMNRMLSDPALVLQETSGRYAPDQEFDPKKLEVLVALIEKFESSDVKVALVLLPIANPVYAVLESSGRYKFIGEARRHLNDLGKEFYDSIDPRESSGTTCEFQDPHHGGNALYARMLRRAWETRPNGNLAKYINYPVVRAVSDEFAGKVHMTTGIETRSFRETDFLNIGCIK